MLSKMAQPNNSGRGDGGGGGSSGGGSSRRAAISLGSTRLQQQQQQQLSQASSNGRSNSPQTGKRNEPLQQQQQQQAAASSIKELKKTNQQHHQQQQQQQSSSSSAAEEKKAGQNGESKSTNGKEKAPQNGNKEAAAAAAASTQKEHKTKEHKKEQKLEIKLKKDFEKELNKKEATNEVVVIVDDAPAAVAAAAAPTTPTAERKSTRKTGNQKSPVSPKQTSAVTNQKKQTPQQEQQQQQQQPDGDVEMEALTVDASPIKNVAQPAATSTPGRSSLFGLRSATKQVHEVELASQPSGSPVAPPPRNFAQITGRRSIRPLAGFTPTKVESYRSVNNELDTSGCTNASMNATVGSEIPNNSSFSFSFFGRGRKRERTPPPLTGSQSATELAQDVEMSPPKRARFEIFSMNLASPFAALRSRFSKASISTPASLRLEQTPPADEDGEGGEVQNVSGVEAAEEEQKEISVEVTVGEEVTGSETPKKEIENSAADKPEDKVELAKEIVANVAEETVAEEPVESANRSRCAIM